MELRQLWRTIWKHRRSAFWVFAGCFFLVAFVTFVMRPVYQAQAKIIIELKPTAMTSDGQDLRANARLVPISQNTNPLATQIEVAKSAPIIHGVVATVGLQDEWTGLPLAPEEFLKRAAVAPIKGTDVIRMTFRDSDPVRAQRVVNAWADAFEKTSRAANRVDASQAVRFISDQLAKNRAELDAAERSLREFKRANGAIDVSEEARTAVQTLATIQAEVRGASADATAASRRVQALRARIGISPRDAIAASTLTQDPTFRRLREQLLDAETGLASAAVGPEHPEHARLTQRVALLQRKLDEQSQALIGRRYRDAGHLATLDPTRQRLTEDLIAAEGTAAANQARLATLNALSARYNGRLASLPDREFRLTQLERVAKTTAGTYKMLQTKLEEARIHEALNLSHVRILEHSPLPEDPLRPKTLPYLLAGLFMGAVLGVGAALLREYLDETIRTPEEAEAVLQLPTLGVLPWLPASGKAAKALLAAPQSPAAEAYRTLRTNIRFLTGADPDSAKALVFASAGPREGKSTTVANLAVAFAMAGKRVLVIDADMRKPRQHQIFGLDRTAGLAEVLRAELALEQAVSPTRHADLQVLTAGGAGDNPSELLESARLDVVLRHARAQYDIVLIDAPPVIAVTDACVLASRADGVILVMQANHVSERAARHALRLLEAANANIRGMVMRGIRPDLDPHYASYFQSYFYEARPATSAS